MFIMAKNNIKVGMVHLWPWRRRRCSSALMMSCMSLILSVECIFFNRFISC